MTTATKNVFIIGAKRTPFGSFGGKLKNFSAVDLGVISSKAAIAHAKISPDLVDETFFGNCIQSGMDSPYLSRHVQLRSGGPIASPSLTINRLCGSGFEALCLGVESILLGRSKVVLTGGSEQMSQSPMVIDGVTARWGVPLGKGFKAEDSLWSGLTDAYAKTPMGMTAENVATKFGITREQCDELSLRSQHLYEKAAKAGIFASEIVSIEIRGRKGPELMTLDEHARSGVKLEDLQKLKPVFKPEGGVVTAGSASGICDGAASVIVASEEAVLAGNLTPLVRVVSWARTGCEPHLMGMGPVASTRAALKAANLTINDIDLIELNEAFASQYLACEKELGVDRSKANLNGGAIAIGHPLGASGARIMAHLTHELVRTGKRYGLGTCCVGGGQGIAVIVENVAR